MTDQPPADNHFSTQAVLSYALIILLAATVGGVFLLIALSVKVDPTMLTVLGTVIAAVIAAAGAVTGFWLGSSSGAKSSNAALAQLAGAGAPPPAQPGSGTPPEEPTP